ncbi:MAG TPA: TlpA disulfide reductase family protein [Candidatus Hydrogenedentes bacterium]|nr:TlpA disulfide reductase family protein [Candidatus Hydrogenedentota bacterium]HOL77426.1 TlpA disulfide reductase family protein [Candidatus Hydrogenedentota bacterium]HPO84569.1 TlpA disulfide reductase family protein [Candidatus Hydrogenedentota bacterium]
MDNRVVILGCLTVGALFFFAGYAMAQNETAGNTPNLKVGDPAPPLKVSEWVKGDAVDLEAQKGKSAVVVEFWATWCPPCRASIPHLTQLQAKYKDRGIVIVGISSEDKGTVKEFVEKAGDKMVYHVAVDDNGKTEEAYMEASGAQGIPHAYIIGKDGKIVWEGHPLEKEFEQTLEKLAAPPKENSEKS